jgi:hypothetical protein
MGKKEFIKKIREIIKNYDYDHASLTTAVDYIVTLSRIYELEHKKPKKVCDPEIVDMMVKQIKSGRKPTDMFSNGEHE